MTDLVDLSPFLLSIPSFGIVILGAPAAVFDIEETA